MKTVYWLCLLYCWLLPAQAEIVLDGTLGVAGALEAPDYQIGAALGQQHGTNLFHSFSTFNIAPTEQATFSGPPEINTIISRVTGGAPSHIAGILRTTIPDADVYLLNPEGVVFSDNAHLNIHGSLYVGATETLQFADGSEFNARFPSLSTLTSAPVAEFGFLTEATGDIQLDNTRLNVPDAASLTFNANVVTLHDSQINSIGRADTHPTTLSIHASQLLLDHSRLSSRSTTTQPGGHIQVNAQHIQLQNDGQIVSSTDSAQSAGDIRLQTDSLRLADNPDSYQTAILSTTQADGDSGGIWISADDITLENGTRISNETRAGGRAGMMHIEATGEILLTGFDSQNQSSDMTAQTYSAGDVNVFTVQADNITLQDGATLGAATQASGNIGDVNIEATDTIRITGGGDTAVSLMGAILLSEGDNASTGSGGDVNIHASNLYAQDGAMIGSITTGQGATGDVTLEIANTVQLKGVSSAGFPTQLLLGTRGSGQAGNLTLRARDLYVLNGAQIISGSAELTRNGTLSSGNTGNIYIVADLIQVDGVSQTPQALNDERLNGLGERTHMQNQQRSESEILQQSSSIQVSAFGNGNAGTINLTASEIIIGNTGNISAGSLNQGNAGNININAEQLYIDNGGIISAVAFGTGSAGNVNIQVQDNVQLSGEAAAGLDNGFARLSGIVVGSLQGGDAGAITIVADNLWIEGGASITANSVGDGTAGNINLKVDEILRLSGHASTAENSSIQVISEGAGRSGSVQIIAGELRVEDGGEISAVSSGSGDAGNVMLNIQGSLYMSGVDSGGKGSNISVESEKDGNAGTLTIKAANLFINDGGIMGAASEGDGNAGNVDIQVADTIAMRGFDSDSQVSLIQASALGQGDAGTLALQAEHLLLRDGAAILGLTLGDGQAGNINIQVEEADIAGRSPEIVQIDRGEFQGELNPASGIYAGTAGSGRGGTINLQATQLWLTDAATINTSSLRSSGNGGEIFIQAGTMVMDDATLFANSFDTGNSGNVDLTIDNTLIMQDSVINTAALLADGGNINITSGGYLRMINSGINTTINAPDGSDGNIHLNTQFIALTSSQITAATASGEAGAIDITTEGLFIFPPVTASEIRATSDLTIRVGLEAENEDNITVLPTAFLQAAALLLDPCSAPDASHFSLAEYAGVGYQPDDLQGPSIAFLPFTHYARQQANPLSLRQSEPTVYYHAGAKTCDARL